MFLLLHYQGLVISLTILIHLSNFHLGISFGKMLGYKLNLDNKFTEKKLEKKGKKLRINFINMDSNHREKLKFIISYMGLHHMVVKVVVIIIINILTINKLNNCYQILYFVFTIL